MTTYACALRMLARRRLTEVALWQRLERKGYADEDICDAVQRCKEGGFVDDRLFAALYIEGKRKPVGDVRLIGELVRKGVDRQAAAAAVRLCDVTEADRCQAAFAAIARTVPDAAYASAARRLERLGFPAATIYRVLREHAADCGPLAGVVLSP